MSHQNGLPPPSTQVEGRQSPYTQGAYSACENRMSKERVKIYTCLKIWYRLKKSWGVSSK